MGRRRHPGRTSFSPIPWQVKVEGQTTDQLRGAAAASGLARLCLAHRDTSLLLDLGHALDHMFLLIFTTAVASVMLLFYFGMGVSALLCALAQNAWQMAVALSVLGLFSAIYHPVGIPMLRQHARKPGLTIGINGLAGNMGIAFAAILTGFTVKYVDWREVSG